MIANKRNFLIFLALIIIIVSSTQIPFHRVTGLIPSLIYPLNLNAGDSIVGTCSWTVSADIDLYLYPSGTDLLARTGYLRKQYSENLNPQILPYNITQTGYYYLRVDLYSKTPTNYKLEIQVNDKIVKTHYDTAIAIDNGITIKQFTTDNICKAKLFYNGPPLNIGIFAPDTNLQQTPLYTMNQNTTQLFFDVTVNGIWNVVLQHGIINSTQILYSFLLNITTISTDKCINYCSNKNNSRGLAPGTTNFCMCKKLYLWNGTSQTCESICQLDPFNPDCITIDCQAIQYTIGPDSNIPNGCICLPTFHFDMQLNLCVINCSDVAFSNGSILNTTDQCECDLHFYFDIQSRCSINCSDILHGLDFVNNTLDQCTCRQNFYFNVSTSSCIVNCSQVAYSIGPVQDTIDRCYCLPRFYYSQSNFRCQAICANINYTTGSLFPDKVDQCLCFPHYYWSPESFSCQSNCISMPYSVGFRPTNNSYACVCRNSYFFNSTLGSCQVNCSQIDKATGFVQNLYNKCLCIPHYYFQQSKGLCLIDCSSIQNSLGIKPVNDLYSCVCRASFYFNVTLETCEVNCSSITNTINRLNNQTCSCTNGFRWNFTTAKCETICGDGYKTDVQECDDGNTQSSDGCSQNCTLQQNNGVSRGLVVGGSIAGGLAVVVAAAVAKISYNATTVASISAAVGQAVGPEAGNVAAHVAGQSAQNIVNMVDPPFQVL